MFLTNIVARFLPQTNWKLGFGQSATSRRVFPGANIKAVVTAPQRWDTKPHSNGPEDRLSVRSSEC